MVFRKKNKKDELDKFFRDKSFRNQILRKNKRANISIGFIAVIFLLCFVVIGGYLGYLSNTLPSLSELENPKLEEATKIYSADGELLDKFYLKNRTRITYEDIPPDMINAVVAIEDRKFFSHWGVDLQRIVQAFIKNAARFNLKKEGASTITQQLARNLYLNSRETTWKRKIREAMTAVQIEKTYTKQEILTYYLNTVYFGKGAYGIEAAAQTYFNKTTKDLTLNECSLLAGLLKSPSNYDPVLNPEVSKGRKNLVLNAMRDEDYITEETYQAMIKENITTVLRPDVIQVSDSKVPEFSEYVRQILQNKAEQYGYDLYRDGLKVYTTLDTRIQKHAEDAVLDQLPSYQKSFNSTWNWKSNKDIQNTAVDKFIKDSEEYKNAKTNADKNQIYEKMKKDQNIIDSAKKLATTVQIGFVVMNPKTGEIKAMIGANPLSRTRYGLNRAAQIRRQPGSSFKPFVYTVAIMNGLSPAYEISNDPISITSGNKTWSPKGGGTGGMVEMRYAIAKSINVVAVRTLMEVVSIDKVIDVAHKMGIKSNLRRDLTLSLGSSEVTPLEMTNAFGVFANEGIWVEPIAITKIEDRNGNLIEKVIPETKEILSEGVAYMMTDMMQDVINQGTATSIRQFFQRPAAGKTGTSQNYTDAWFIGYTPQFVAGIWLGFDDARIKFGGAYGQGGRAAAPIWGKFMKLLYDDEDFDLPLVDFYMPNDVIETNICTMTGLPSNGSCPAVLDICLKKYKDKKCPLTHQFMSSSEESVPQGPEMTPGTEPQKDSKPKDTKKEAPKDQQKKELPKTTPPKDDKKTQPPKNINKETPKEQPKKETTKPK